MAAEAGAAAPPAAEKKDDDPTRPAWPPPEKQLEMWMMNTVREGDQAAKFLRSMLQTNPAYGTYLTTDQDLVDVVAMFSKRLKTKLSSYESPDKVPTNCLHQPLCEMVWRVVGYVMHSVIELEEEANMPVPKEASGMIKMLLHTNSQLSNKLNELRRAYLRELSEHRDRQRRISTQTQNAINNLHEQPIMFFEPLEFVLDETTKDFVREAVEERMKLEMRNAFSNNDDNAEMMRQMEELEAQIELLKAENKTCKASNTRLENEKAHVKEALDKAREDLKAEREANKEKQKALDDLEDQCKKLQNELNAKNRRLEHLEQKVAELEGRPVQTETAIQYDDNSEELERLQNLLLEMEKKNKEQARAMEKLQAQLDAANGKAPQVIQGEERIVEVEDKESKRLLEQALQVERELRAANEALEKALAEAEDEANRLRKELGQRPLPSKKPEKPPEPKPKKPTGPSAEDVAAQKDDEHRKNLEKVKAAHQKKIDEMQAEIDRLRALLEEAEEEMRGMVPAGSGEPKEPKVKVVKKVGISEEELTKWKVKCHEQEQRIEQLEDDYAKLEQKCAMLMEKLKEKFSDAEIEQIVEKIRLAPPPATKKKRKKAWERLYDDAQRRIIEMKMRQDKLRQLEERSLRSVRRIAVQGDANKVEMLHHLHSAHQASAQRFHEALAGFQRARMVKIKADEDGDEETSEGEEEYHTFRRRGCSDLEEFTLQVFKGGVCPRCAFSALTTFKRLSQPPKEQQPQAQATTTSFGGTQASFGTPWHPNQANMTLQSEPGGQRYFRAEGRGLSPTMARNPEDMFATIRPGSRPTSRSGSPQGRSGSPLGAMLAAQDPRQRTLPGLSSPLGSGPSPGAMPFDASFPMPSPPWRQPSPEHASSQPLPPEIAGSGSNPAFASTAPPFARGGGGGGDPARDLLDEQNLPPWRRARSNSPVRGGEVQPPSGGPPNRPPGTGLGHSSSYGRLGRPPGPDWTAPVPGRVPAASTMALDPIVGPRSVSFASDPSPRPRVGKSSSRSPSPEWTSAKAKTYGSDGFRKMRTMPPDLSQLEPDFSRPSSGPPFNKPSRSSSNVDLASSMTSMTSGQGERAIMGGGGRGTQHVNLHSGERPTVPSSRSVPQLPVVNSGGLRTPHGLDSTWELSTPSKKLTQKASKKGQGFVVKPLVSQERLGQTGGASPAH